MAMLDHPVSISRSGGFSVIAQALDLRPSDYAADEADQPLDRGRPSCWKNWLRRTLETLLFISHDRDS